MKNKIPKRTLILGSVLGLALCGFALCWMGKKNQQIWHSLRLSKSFTKSEEIQTQNIELGIKLVRSQQFAEAKKIFERILAADMDNVSVLNNLGYVSGEMGKLSVAKEYLKKAIELFPQCAECLNNLGAVLIREGNRVEARAKFEKALELYPQYVDALLNLGVLFEEDSEWSSAWESFRRASGQISDPELKKWVDLRVGLLAQIPQSTRRELAHE